LIRVEQFLNLHGYNQTMRNGIAAFLLFGWVTMPAAADELVLKDGKTIVWTVLRDLGNSYEVETADGVKLEIRKDQVVKFVPKDRLQTQKEAATAALTGATFTWEKGRKLTQFDLLKSIDAKRDGLRGNWKLANGILSFDSSGMKTGIMTMLETTYAPPEEYDLTLVAERAAAGDNVFFVGLPGSDHQVAWAMDSPGGWQGPWLVDGKNPEASKLGIKERLFDKVGNKRTLIFSVRKFGLGVKLDGKDYFAWRGDWSQMKPGEPYHPEKNTRSIYFGGALSSSFKISSAIVTYPKE
jgi:hypothetical protein